MTMSRASPMLARISAVRSAERSLTTITSRSAYVCASIARTVCSIRRSSLRAGMTTETCGPDIPVWPSRGPDRNVRPTLSLGTNARLRIAVASEHDQAMTRTISNVCTRALRGGRADATLRIERIGRIGILTDDLPQRFLRLLRVALRVVRIRDQRKDRVRRQDLILRLAQLLIQLDDDFLRFAVLDAKLIEAVSRGSDEKMLGMLGNERLEQLARAGDVISRRGDAREIEIGDV